MRKLLSTFALLLICAVPAWGGVMPRALLICSYHPGFPTFSDQICGLQSVLLPKGIALDVEFMDSKRFPDAETRERFTDSLAEKLKRLPPYHIVITADDNALALVEAERTRLFPDTPVVFFGVNDQTKGYWIWGANKGFTGVLETVSIEATLKSIRDFFPHSSNLWIISDGTVSGKSDLKTLYTSPDRFDFKFHTLGLDSMTYDQLFAKTQNLTVGEDVLLLLSSYHDVNGNKLSFADFVKKLHMNSPVPAFHLWKHGVGEGLVGGKVVSHYQQGIQAAQLVLKILDGVEPETLPVVSADRANIYLFDYNELKRFGISTALVPKEATILNMPESIWKKHGTILVPTLVVIAVLVGAVLVLLHFYRLRVHDEQLRVLSEHRYRVLVENAPDGILLLGTKGTIEDANEAARAMFGTTDLIGRQIREFYAKDNTQDYDQLKEELQTTGRLKTVLHAKNMNGDDMEVFVDAVRIDDSAFIALCKNITESSHNQLALHESEERFRSLVDQAGDLIFVFRESGTIELVNQEACDRLGYVRSTLLEMDFSEVSLGVCEDDCEELSKQVGPWSFEGEMQQSDGQVFPAEIRLGQIQFEGDTAWLALVRDITDRKAYENTLLNESKINLAQVDVARTLTEPNPIIDEVAGRVLEHAKKMTDSDHGYVSSIDPETEANVMHTFTSMVMDGTCLMAEKKFIFHKEEDGYPNLWGHSLNTKSPMFTNEPRRHLHSNMLPEGHVALRNFLSVPAMYRGKLVGQIALANSSRNYGPEDIRIISILANLFALAVQRKRTDDELVRARDEAEAASRSKSEFLANMSHEVRTPLNGIFGMLQLALDSGLTEEQDEYVGTALDSGRKLLNVLNDILDFSKVEAGKIELRYDDFSLHDILHESRAIFGLQARDKGLTLNLDVQNACQDRVCGDGGRLRQVLFNLLGNAVKFTDSGEVSLGCYPLPPNNLNDIRLLFVVEDTGIGVPETKLDAIFNPFEQVDGSRTRRHPGTGLGLGIVRRFVEMMGGEVAFESEFGVGTTVSFCVTLGHPQLDALPVMKQAAIEHTGSLRILLAEDDRVNQIAARKMLERMGHEVSWARNGQEAIEMLQAGVHDCVLMDVQMPIMDGVEATRKIRTQNPGGKGDIPIIALTAHAMKGDREQFLEAGMDGYVAKPFDVNEVRTALAMAMGASRENKFD